MSACFFFGGSGDSWGGLWGVLRGVCPGAQFWPGVNAQALSSQVRALSVQLWACSHLHASKICSSVLACSLLVCQALSVVCRWGADGLFIACTWGYLRGELSAGQRAMPVLCLQQAVGLFSCVQAHGLSLHKPPGCALFGASNQEHVSG
jgi:hypothetical protein